MKHWKVLLLALVAILPGFVLDPRSTLDLVWPVKSTSMSCGTVELGSMAPGTTHQAEIELRNHSYRTVDLLPVQSDCGCVMVHGAPRQMAPQEVRKIPLAIRAPSKPGPFSRMLVFAPQSNSAIKWVGRIKGTVEADVWTEPRELILRADPGQLVEGVVAVRHAPDRQIGSIRPSNDLLHIVDQRPLENGQLVKVRLRNSPESAAASPALQIVMRGTPDEEPIAVPIRCISTPIVSFVPRRIDLDEWLPIGESNGIVRVTVVALLSTDHDPGELHFESLVPWIDLKRERVSESTWKMELSFDLQRFPQSLSEPVLRVTSSAGTGDSVLLASRAAAE